MFNEINDCKKQCCFRTSNTLNNAKAKIEFQKEWFYQPIDKIDYTLSNDQNNFIETWAKNKFKNKTILKNFKLKKDIVVLNNLFVNSLEYIVLDIETTGLKPEDNESLIQFGYFILNKKFEIIDQGEFLIQHFHSNGNIKVPFYNNLSEQEIREKGISINDAIIKMMTLLKNRTIIAHNKKFDISFLHWYIGCYLFDYGSVEDVSYWKNYFYKDNNSYIKHMCTGKMYKIWKLCTGYGVSKWNLKFVCNELNVEYSEYAAHTSLYDAEKTKDIFIKLFKLLEIGINNWL